VIDIFSRIVLNPYIGNIKQILFSGALITPSLTILDLVTLLYIVPNADLNALTFIIKIKVILTVATGAVLIHKFGGKKQWRKYNLLLVFSMICIGRIFSIFRLYFKGNIWTYMTIVNIICDISGVLFFIILSIKWFLFIYQETKFKSLTKDQYLCNVYVLSLISCAIGWVLSVYSNNSNTDWCYTNTFHLILYTFSYGVYYVFIFMFEGRAIQREIIATKVR